MSELLRHVKEVERFIAACRVDGERGALWRRTPDTDATPHTLYHGAAGVALFYLELHRATGDPTYRDEAVSAGDQLLWYLNQKDWITVGLYSGLPAYAFVLNELALHTGDQRFRYGARRCLQRLGEQSESLGAGIGWVEPMPFSDITGITGDRELIDLSVGAAGAGLAFVYGVRQDLEERSLDWANRTADRLIEVADETSDGLNWPMMADMPFPFTAPNFAHGAAGVGFFLADLYRVTSIPKHLDAAQRAARYVQAHAADCGDGVLVCHTTENRDLNYLGVCHGPPGSGRLFHLLGQIDGTGPWQRWRRANLRGLLATGAPEQRSEGLWQNYGQCCGDAGIGDYALWMYRSTGDPEYLDIANRVAEVILGASAVDDGKRWWVQAEHRSRPDFVEAQTGYMQGAAGIASFLLHLATVDDARPSKISPLDAPF